jgi:hypothetical protein
VWYTNCIYRDVLGVGGFPFLLSLLILVRAHTSKRGNVSE